MSPFYAKSIVYFEEDIFFSVLGLFHIFPIYVFQEADMSLNFEEQILEAAKSIASATAALVKSASAAQRELVAQGKVSQQWIEFRTVL